MLSDAIIHGLIAGSVYALVALGYSLVYSVMGFVNFAHGDLLAVGVYLCLALGPGWLHLPLFLAALIAALVTGLIAAGLGRWLLIPAANQSSLAALLVAIGISVILQSMIAAVFTSEALPFYAGNFLGQQVASWLPLKWLHVETFLGSTTSLAALWPLFFRKSLLGIEIRASASNPRAAQILGLRRDLVFTFVFFLAGVFAAAAGIAVGLDDRLVVPTLGVGLGMRAFVASVIGGIHRLEGAVAGGLLLGLLENLVAAAVLKIPVLAPHAAVLSKDTLALLILAAVLMWRPKGLFYKAAEARP